MRSSLFLFSLLLGAIVMVLSLDVCMLMLLGLILIVVVVVGHRPVSNSWAKSSRVGEKERKN